MGLFDGFFGNNVPLSAGYRRHERAADRAASEGRGADARRERRRMLGTWCAPGLGGRVTIAGHARAARQASRGVSA